MTKPLTQGFSYSKSLPLAHELSGFFDTDHYVAAYHPEQAKRYGQGLSHAWYNVLRLRHTKDYYPIAIRRNSVITGLGTIIANTTMESPGGIVRVSGYEVDFWTKDPDKIYREDVAAELLARAEYLRASAANGDSALLSADSNGLATPAIIEAIREQQKLRIIPEIFSLVAGHDADNAAMSAVMQPLARPLAINVVGRPDTFEQSTGDLPVQVYVAG